MTDSAGTSIRPRLSRGFVVSFRRRRITGAMAELCVERGYRATTIAHVAARAGTTRNAVYENFANKEAIFLALIEEAIDDLVAGVEAACRGAGQDPDQRVGAVLGAVLDWVAANPALAWGLLVEAPCSCPAAFERHLATSAKFAGLLRASFPPRPDRPSVVEEMLVGGIASMLRYLVHNGEAERAPELLPTLAAFAAIPYGLDDFA